MWHDCPWDSHPPSDSRILTSTAPIMAFNNEPESLKVVFERNVFNFDRQNIIQIKGTAIGTKVAPKYATLVLGYLENILYSIN